MVTENEIVKYARRALIDELYSEAIYRKLAKLYKNDKVSEKLIRSAEIEGRHAKFWIKFLERKMLMQAK